MKDYNRHPAEIGKRKLAEIKNNYMLEIMILFTILLIVIMVIK